MDLGLEARVGLVTGASSGIGAAVAGAFVREGMHVAISARRAEQLQEVADAIAVDGAQVLAVPGDMGSTDDVESVVSQTVTAFGGIDVLVNNAGATLFARLEDVPDERWLSDLNTKLLGYVRCTRIAAPHLEKSDRACIVNVGGNGGRQPLPYHLPGGAANAAILNFTQAMGQYLGPRGVRVVGVAPGLVDTPRLEKQLPVQAAMWGVGVDEAREQMVRDVPVGRISEAEDIADVVCFVASPRARQVHGTTITVDGGATRGI